MRKHPPTKRLFAAILPPAAWIEGINRFQQGLMRTFGDAVRWVDPKTYHITVRFFGNIETQLAGRLISEWQQHPCPLSAPLLVAPAVGGCFPPEGAPRVVWAGASAPIAVWNEVLSHIAHRLSALEIEYPTSQFTPHITLGRIKDCSHIAALRDHSGVKITELTGFEATHLDLMLSQQTHVGNRYTSVARCPFLYCS